MEAWSAVVVVGHRDGIDFVRIDGTTEHFAQSDIARWSMDTGRHEVALATTASVQGSKRGVRAQW